MSTENTLSVSYRLKSVPKANVIPFYGDTDRLLKDGLNMEKGDSMLCLHDHDTCT